MKKRCKITVLSEKLHSEIGSAAIITLSVILVLTTLGTVSLIASAMNVRMSGKTISWSEEYYTLDAKAEEYIHLIDELVLIPAEKDARTYVMNRLDRVKPDDLSGFYDSSLTPAADPYDMKNSGAQEYFNKYYLEFWTYTDEFGTVTEYTLGNYEKCIIDGTFYGKTIEEISRYRFDTSDSTLTDDQKAAKAYKHDLTDYTRELFDRVYFYMVAKRLEFLHQHATYYGDFSSAKANIVIKRYGDENYGQREETDSYRCTYKFCNIGVQTWESMKPNNGDIVLYIRAEDDNIPDKEVRVAIEVTLPNYQVIEKDIYTPVYGNPIWANALTVRGNIEIGKSTDAVVTIKGDVYASGSSGISIYNNTTANIHGNVYTAGNVQAVSNRAGNGGKLRVYTSETGGDPGSYSFKRIIYENDFLHEDRYGFSEEYTARRPNDNNMTFIFNDYFDKGNVYCESLEVAEGVVDAKLIVDGNLWTMDDIQMDGQLSEIKVGTAETRDDGKVVAKYSYVGLNGESEETDPNKSSSVINNFPFKTDRITTNSTITINSNFYIPGVAFYNFFNSSDPASRLDKFYKSVESATSRTEKPSSILGAYVDSGGTDIYYNQDGDEFRLTEESVDNQRRKLVNFINSIGGVYTNIITNLSEPGGYVAGIALVEKQSGKATIYASNPSSELPGAVALVNSGNNKVAFDDLMQDDKLLKLFRSKTKMLGKYSDTAYSTTTPPINFSQLVETSMLSSMSMSDLIYKNGGTLDTRIIDSGIVYCTGDLTITGNGDEFRGAIICDGNVTIEGNVKITYDEGVIRQKLKNSAKVRQFFRKGEMGGKLFDIEEYATSSGRRIEVKRYRITVWKETVRTP